jgi:hypothetical protein
VDYARVNTVSPLSTPYDPTEDYRPVGESTIRPLLPFTGEVRAAAVAAKRERRMDWLLWAGVLVVALATTAAVVYLLPRVVNL